MALIERLIGEGDVEKLSIHAIGSTLRLLQSSLITKPQALARWPELTGTDISDLGDIMDRITGSAITGGDVESALILGESGKMNATEIRSILGL